jgi:hypothetical protein
VVAVEEHLTQQVPQEPVDLEAEEMVALQTDPDNLAQQTQAVVAAAPVALKQAPLRLAEDQVDQEKL